jgi:hypothetical protein
VDIHFTALLHFTYQLCNPASHVLYARQQFGIGVAPKIYEKIVVVDS